MNTTILPPPSPRTYLARHLPHHDDEEEIDLDADADTASQKSISLSSPPRSRQNSIVSLGSDPRQSFTTQSSGSVSNVGSKSSGGHSDSGERNSYIRPSYVDSPLSSIAPSVIEDSRDFKLATYPPPPPPLRDDAMSISSFASTSSRKARPESLLITPTKDPLVLGVALVDFNHLVGPRIEYSKGEIFEDDEVAKILPFLALPDGAHLSAEDYSYFHLVKPGPTPTTIFGISCNQQVASSVLLVKGPDVTRSTVQKAVVVLASKPVFGPIRNKLQVVTTALFLQRDFRDASILDDFGVSLERSLRTQLTESGLYMGTSIRELIHNFRQKTLILVKALMLQKRIMFFGFPVEKLCTYQYSLVSLLPGLLQTLDDCGSPPLAARAPTLSRPTSLKTSDHRSMMAFMGLPLDIFGKDAFFQPYLPLQQMDMIKHTPSWLCGCTNSIITQQSEIDLLVNTETGIFEFRDPKLERAAGLTAADRKWMDDILTDVNASWTNEDAGHSTGMHEFKGSDDYLRSKFEEYISAALSSVKYRDFLLKGENGGVIITGGMGQNTASTEDFNPLWMSEFKRTNAYEVWERTTDPLLFDIVEPRHPCNEKPSVVSDIGLRLQEGIQELKLEQQLAPAREAVARTLTVGSTSFFKAVEGVRGKWAQRSNSTLSTTSSISSGYEVPPRSGTPPVEVSKVDFEDAPRTAKPADYVGNGGSKLRPFSLTSTNSLPDSPSAVSPTNATLSAIQSPLKPLSTWSAGIGSFLSSRTSKFSLSRSSPPAQAEVNSNSFLHPHEDYGPPEGSPLFNGMSPGASPTTNIKQDSSNLPNIAGVLSASDSSQTVVPAPSNSNGGSDFPVKNLDVGHPIQS